MQINFLDGGSELCLSCGLCCNGAMFEEITFGTGLENLEPARALGFKPEKKDGSQFVEDHPCQAHREGKCTIYANRFQNCKEFKCKLLKNYKKGVLDFELASSQIHKTKELYELLKQELGCEENQSFWKTVRKLWEQCPDGPDGLEFRRKHAGLMLKILSLTRLLGKYFFEDNREKWLVLKAGFKI